MCLVWRWQRQFNIDLQASTSRQTGTHLAVMLANNLGDYRQAETGPAGLAVSAATNPVKGLKDIV
jgi:hypothetical protein